MARFTRNGDRTYLLNEAKATSPDVQQWQIEQIKQSLRQADAGELVGHGEVKKKARKWRRG